MRSRTLAIVLVESAVIYGATFYVVQMRYHAQICRTLRSLAGKGSALADYAFLVFIKACAHERISL